MPYSTGCCTSLSNFEAGQNYKDVDDPAVTVCHFLALLAHKTLPTGGKILCVTL